MQGGYSSLSTASGLFLRKRHHLSSWGSLDIFRTQAKIPLCGGNGEAKDNKIIFIRILIEKKYRKPVEMSIDQNSVLKQFREKNLYRKQ